VTVTSQQQWEQMSGTSAEMQTALGLRQIDPTGKLEREFWQKVQMQLYQDRLRQQPDNYAPQNRVARSVGVSQDQVTLTHRPTMAVAAKAQKQTGGFSVFGLLAKTAGKLLGNVKDMFTVRGIATTVGLGVVGTLTGTLPLMALFGVGMAAAQTGMGLIKAAVSKTGEEAQEHLSDALAGGIMGVFAAWGAKQSLGSMKSFAGAEEASSQGWLSSGKYYWKLLKGDIKSNGANFWTHIADTSKAGFTNVTVRGRALFSSKANRAEVYNNAAKKIAENMETATPNQKVHFGELKKYFEKRGGLQGLLTEQEKIASISRKGTQSAGEKFSADEIKLNLSRLSKEDRVLLEKRWEQPKMGENHEIELEALRKLRIDEAAELLLEQHLQKPHTVESIQQNLNSILEQKRVLLANTGQATEEAILTNRLKLKELEVKEEALKRVKGIIDKGENIDEKLTAFKKGIDTHGAHPVNLKHVLSPYNEYMYQRLFRYNWLKEQKALLEATPVKDEAALRTVGEKLEALKNAEVKEIIGYSEIKTSDLGKLPELLKEVPTEIQSSVIAELKVKYANDTTGILRALKALDTKTSAATYWLAGNFSNGKILSTVSGKIGLDSFAAFLGGDEGGEEHGD